ncbi:MAG: HAD family hydrolase [Nanoarchaeota archaeon]|nr:HAD family hydrolase [Nanoarchaeota archaeon]
MKPQETEYRHFASLLSGQIIRLPYSGDYESPGYKPGNSGVVHGYDLGGTLANAAERDNAIIKILWLEPNADIKKQLFNDKDATRNISRAQEDGILNGSIRVDALDGVVEQLAREQERGEDRVLITVGTYQMARSFIHGAKLEDYVSALVTSEEANAGNQKPVETFLRVYEKLREKGQIMATYCDDSEKEAKAALEASKLIGEKYGGGFTVFLIKKDAKDNELGLSDSGCIIIRSIKDKENFEA